MAGEPVGAFAGTAGLKESRQIVHDLDQAGEEIHQAKLNLNEPHRPRRNKHRRRVRRQPSPAPPTARPPGVQRPDRPRRRQHQVEEAAAGDGIAAVGGLHDPKVKGDGQQQGNDRRGPGPQPQGDARQRRHPDAEQQILVGGPFAPVRPGVGVLGRHLVERRQVLRPAQQTKTARIEAHPVVHLPGRQQGSSPR